MKYLLSNSGKHAGATVAVAVLGAFAPIALGSDNVTVVRHLSVRTFVLRAQPSSRTVLPGSVARYRIAIRRTSFRGPVALWVGSGLPAFAYARFAPSTTRRSITTLIVATSARSRPGRYRLRLKATSAGTSRGVAVTLTIAGNHGRGAAGPIPSAPFTIAGDASNLELGVAHALDLSVTNPNPVPLVLGSLIVGGQTVDAPRATASLPCTLADFSVQQFSGPYPVIVPAASTSTLSSLGIPSAQWPQVAIIARPVDQDGCKSATLTLTYSGNATLG